MFNFNISDELRLIIRKLIKKDKKKVKIINKKIKEIIKNNSETIKRYKNLRYDLNDFKRVHIEKSFILVFHVDIKNNFILFVDFDHHDKVYGKKFSV